MTKNFFRFYDIWKFFDCHATMDHERISGEWLDALTGIPNTHIRGEHLCLPGYEKDHPTLEIFSYNVMLESDRAVNKCGIAHLAFEVDDVEVTLQLLLEKGGKQIGELIKTEYDDGRKAVFVYAADCEGNIIELQNWS